MRPILLLGCALSLALPAFPMSADQIDQALLRGNSYRLAGNYVLAEQSIRKALNELEAMQNADVERLSGAYNYLALVENNAGKYAESERHARKAIALASKAGLPEAARAMHSVVLANALRQQGKFREAESILVTAIPVLRKEGSDQLLIGTAINNLGAIYFCLGEFRKAMPLIEEGLRIRTAAGGADHVDVANSYLDLGATEFRLGQTAKAFEHVSKSIEIRTKALGQRHPETLASAAVLAVILQSQGKITEASNMLERVVSTAKSVLGSRHPDLAQYQDSYANLLAQQNAFREAISIQQDSLKIRKEVFGTKSREYAAGLRSLAFIESAAGHEARAGELLKESGSIYAAAAQMPDLDYADTLDELATHYVRINNLDAARLTFADAVAVRASAGPSVPYAISLANLSDVLSRLNRHADSIQTLKKAKTIIDALPEGERANPDCTSIIERLTKESANH